MASPSVGRRTFPFIDAIRGAAAMVILTHHLITYVPRADELLSVMPAVRHVVWWYGGLATQVFLVISGFVGGCSLARSTPEAAGLGRLLLIRYLRLAVPAVVTLLAAIGLEAIVPRSYASFPLFEEISLPAVLAHVVLLQDVIGYPSVLAGFWYLSIDWQCQAAMCLLIVAQDAVLRRLPGLPRAARWTLVTGVPLAVAAISLACWNGVAAHEAYATYFFGIMFLGTLAGLAVAGGMPPAIFWAYALACGTAAVVQHRPQPAVALATGVAIYLLARRRSTLTTLTDAPLEWLGRISYALFLVHYPVIWLVTSLAKGVFGDGAEASWLCLTVAVAASIGAAASLHRLVEVPTRALLTHLKPSAGQLPLGGVVA